MLFMLNKIAIIIQSLYSRMQLNEFSKLEYTKFLALKDPAINVIHKGHCKAIYCI